MICYICPQLIQSTQYKVMELVKRGMNVQAPKDFVATYTVLIYDSCYYYIILYSCYAIHAPLFASQREAKMV